MNKPAILALSPLLAAVAFELTLLGAGFCSGRVGDLPPAVGQSIAPVDRQFLAALEEQSRKESQIAARDRELLAEMQVRELAQIPRATFVAPPQRALVALSESVPSEISASPSDTALIPRATFVAPPRLASHFASPDATPLMPSAQTMPALRAEAVNGTSKISPRRSSIIIFNGKVFSTTRATVMN